MPEGLSATVAARFLMLDRRHAAIKQRVLVLAEEFRSRKGYRPPEWQLLQMAKQAWRSCGEQSARGLSARCSACEYVPSPVAS